MGKVNGIDVAAVVVCVSSVMLSAHCNIAALGTNQFCSWLDNWQWCAKISMRYASLIPQLLWSFPSSSVRAGCVLFALLISSPMAASAPSHNRHGCVHNSEIGIYDWILVRIGVIEHTWPAMSNEQIVRVHVLLAWHNGCPSTRPSSYAYAYCIPQSQRKPCKYSGSMCRYLLTWIDLTSSEFAYALLELIERFNESRVTYPSITRTQWNGTFLQPVDFDGTEAMRSDIFIFINHFGMGQVYWQRLVWHCQPFILTRMRSTISNRCRRTEECLANEAHLGGANNVLFVHRIVVVAWQ